MQKCSNKTNTNANAYENLTKLNLTILPHVWHRTDPAVGTWATTWMSGIALAILVISLISGAIFALYWARKNKRNMKAAYPGKSSGSEFNAMYSE